MYLLGVWLADYYNWWERITATRPGWWMAGIFVVQFPLQCSLLLIPPVWFLLIYPVCVLAVLPAYFAASKQAHIKSKKRDEAWQANRKVQRMIERGIKK